MKVTLFAMVGTSPGALVNLGHMDSNLPTGSTTETQLEIVRILREAADAIERMDLAEVSDVLE